MPKCVAWLNPMVKGYSKSADTSPRYNYSAIHDEEETNNISVVGTSEEFMFNSSCAGNRALVSRPIRTLTWTHKQSTAELL